MKVCYNKQLEIKVLGLVLVYPDLLKQYGLDRKLFFTPKARELFGLIETLSKEGKDFTDLELLKSRGADIELVRDTMQTDSFSKGHFYQDYKELSRLAIYREALLRLYNMVQEAEKMPLEVDDFVVKMDGMVADIVKSFKDEDSPYIKDIIEKLEKHRKSIKESPVGFKTGFDMLDRITGGFLPRFIWICGAWTNAGKTFFALQLILNALKQKKKCLLFSLEMSSMMNASRLLGTLSGVGALEIFQGFNSEIVSKQIAWISKQPLLIYDNKMRIEDIRSAARKHHLLEKGLDFIVIDYIQNVQEEGSIYENMSRAAMKANLIAQETNASILLVSQISQSEAMRTTKSGIITYKGAGELAAAPDVGLFLERLKNENDEVVPDRMICRIAKNRHGGLGRMFLKFDPTSGFLREDANQEF